MFQGEILSSHRLVEFVTEKPESLRETEEVTPTTSEQKHGKVLQKGNLNSWHSNVTRSLMVEDFFFLLPPCK